MERLRGADHIEPMFLDSFISRYDFHEFHEIQVPAPSYRVFGAIKECTLGELPVMRILMAVRLLPALLRGKRGLGLDGGPGFLQEFIDAGFLLLAEQPDRELVVGRIGQFWKLTGGEYPRVTEPDAFVGFECGGFAKAATNFILEAHRDGSTVVSTETRIAATDASAQRKFGAYWALIRPGSALIRREWLHAIKRRAIRDIKLPDL